MYDYIPSESEIARAYTLKYKASDDLIISKLFQLIESTFKITRDPKNYAKSLGLSYRQLSRITIAKINMTPNECLQQRVHEEATRMLKYTELSVKEISYELGICDPSHFTRCFKKITGLSPMIYREQNKYNVSVRQPPYFK